MACMYETVQVPAKFVINKKNQGSEVANYLKQTINDMAAKGWEFQSVEMIGIEDNPGSIKRFFGAKYSFNRYYVIIFRKLIANANVTVQS